MAPTNLCDDDITMPMPMPTAVRYGGTSSPTHRASYDQDKDKEEEFPEDFYERLDFEYKKLEERFAVMNFRNKLPSKVFVRYVPIKQKRFRQKNK